MAKLQQVRQASGNPLWRIFVQDSSSVLGAGLTGLTSASTGLKATLIRELDAATTNYTVAGATIEAVTTLGTYAAPTATKIRFKEIDATNFPGWYEVHAAQAITGTGDVSRFTSGMLFGATNMAPCPFEIQLGAVDIQDATRGGMTALPNAAAEAAGGLYTRGTGAGQIKQTNNGEIDANAAHVNNIATTSVTTVAAVIGMTGASTPQTGDAFARLGAPANASTAADIAAVKADSAAIKVQTDKFVFTVVGMADVNVVDWKGAAAAAMTGDAFARLGAPTLASIAADIQSRSTYAGADTAGTGTLLTRIPGTIQPQTGDAFARLGAPVNASISADIAGVPAADNAAVVESTTTKLQVMRAILAVAGGARSGFGTASPLIKSADGLKNRIQGGSADGLGNAIITLDLT